MLLLLLSAAVARAQEPDTVANLSLEKSTITELLKKPIVVNSRGISGEVNVDKIHAVPSFLGNADPIRFIRLLPSVQLNTEVEGGLYMQGGDHSHTLVSQGGVPLYGASHLLGMFSVFNTPHFKGMQYSTSAGQESRLGGIIDLQLKDTLARKIFGEASVGLISAQGTIGFPIGKKSSLTLSARRTYINLLYGNFLKFEDKPIKYGFTDANITWQWNPTKRDRIWVDAFGCLDDANFHGGLLDEIVARWYNIMGAIHWNHYFPGATLKQTVYGTTYGLDMKLNAFNIYGELPSYIRDYGYKSTLHWGDWEFGAHLSYYHVQPQNPYSQGYFNDSNNNGSEPKQDAFEALMSAHYSRNIGYWLQVKAGLGANWYLSPEGKSWFGLSPEVDLIGNFMDAGKVDLRYGIRRQNLFQVGLTNTGLPFEFWVMAGDVQAPQWSHDFSLSYNVDLFKQSFSVSAEVYYKILHNQLEYVGNVMDIYNGDYSLKTSTQGCEGTAYGVNLMIQRQKGKLTGWISYAFSRSLRTFDGDVRQGKYSSNHERLHELDVVATYDFGRFDVGGTFVLASGTPYTKPLSFYVAGSRLICQYGPYNGSRLPPYMKMDLSANWYIKKGPKGKCGINFSMYNVFGRNNVVGYGLHMNKDFTAYTFKPSVIEIRFLPSVGYFHTF